MSAEPVPADNSDDYPELPLSEARARFPDLVKAAEFRNEITCVTRRGHGRVAAIVPMEVIELLERVEDEYWSKRAKEVLGEMARTGEQPIPAEEVYRELGL
jgi:prevent-host-death family protein